ncbi:MAG TPA: signal peptidase I, partial [Polyangia bacterium]
MKAPSRLLRVLFAWFGYSSVHFAAGRWKRGLVWLALYFGLFLVVLRVPMWILLIVAVGQIVDAALIKPAVSRATRWYALAALISACAAVPIALTLRATWIEAFKIPAGSMIPTLQVGDHILVDKTAKHPARGEVTVFRYPNNPRIDFVKRVVAVGGDTIEIRNGQLVLNGQPVPRVHVDGPCEYDDRADDEGA